MDKLPEVNKREVTKVCKTLYDITEYEFSDNVKEELLHFDDIGNLIQVESMPEDFITRNLVKPEPLFNFKGERIDDPFYDLDIPSPVKIDPTKEAADKKSKVEELIKSLNLDAPLPNLMKQKISSEERRKFKLDFYKLRESLKSIPKSLPEYKIVKERAKDIKALLEMR